MARPSFTIDPIRLRALREEHGLTQAALAARVARRMGKPETDSLVRHYQRVEETGQTSLGYATALAAILDVSVPLLQGVESPDPNVYLQQMQTLLAQRLESGENLALRAFRDRHGHTDDEEVLGYLAEDIAELVERVQLVRNPTRIAELIKLTGLPESDLLAPANVQGFWFLSVSSELINCTEVVNGVASVNYRIGELMREYLPQNGGDTTVRMWYDEPWVRIEIGRPQIRSRMLIDCTRCLPDATGMRWRAPSWRDRFFLEPGLISHAFANSDVVTVFGGRTAPTNHDCLRLVVDEHDGNSRTVLSRMVVHGAIDEVWPEVKENFARDCSTRLLYMTLLTNGLKDVLMPHLDLGAARGWRVKVNGAAVDISLEDSSNRGFLYAEPRYRITLAEQTGPDEFSTVPVREKDLEKLKKHIEDWLSAPADLSTGAEERRAFKPV